MRRLANAFAARIHEMWIELNTQIQITPGRRQSKTLLTIDERRSKIVRNNVFDCHLSPIGRQMGIENSVSNDF